MLNEIIIKDSIEQERIKLSGICILLTNAVILVIAESEFKIGNLAVATPVSTVPTTSVNIFPAIGGKGEFAARVIAEHISTLLGKGAIVILNLKEYDKKRTLLALSLAKKMVLKEK